MRIASIGASGFVGSAILHEALNHGHEVTAIVRARKALTGNESDPNLAWTTNDDANSQALPQYVDDRQ